MERDQPTLVTGAGGQVGLAFAELIPDAILLNRSDLDVTQRTNVMDTITRFKPNVIINAAAYTNVDGAETESEMAFRVNAEAVSHLAEAAAKVDSLLVHISTEYVFSGDKGSSYSENDTTGPLSIYGKSKLAGETAASSWQKHLIVRTSWVYGKGRNFITAVLAASNERDEIEVVDDQVGCPTFALDLAEGILRLVGLGARGIYHIAGGGPPGSWADVAELALRSAGKLTKVRRVSTTEYYSNRSQSTAPRPKNSVLDCEKASAQGIRLKPWRETVVDYVKEIA